MSGLDIYQIAFAALPCVIVLDQIGQSQSFLSMSEMLSLTLANGSLMVHVLKSHNPLTVTHEVINKGPSIARMTSKADISLALRDSV